MKIAFTSNKGGVGKTTLALLLTLALRKAGHVVALQDYDAQGTASQTMVHWPSLAEANASPAFVIYDSPPTLAAPSTRAAIDTADLILIPTSADPFSFWEADKSALFALARNPQAKVRLVLNRSKPQAKLTKIFLEQASARPVPTLPCHLGDRPSYQHAAITGWDSLQPDAATELLLFTSHVIGL